jgi:hypothetical protein
MTLRLLAAALAAAVLAPSAAAADHFVHRSGTALVLEGKPYRFGGANIEWLGLAGYGPADPAGPRYPSRFEVDGALAPASGVGARVVRSQTLGDSVGCDLCLEPSPGVFNDAAFERGDYALAAARRYGLRVIPTLVGDDARTNGGGCVYLAWRGVDAPSCSLSFMPAFYTEEAVVADVERHIAAVLNHVNRYTHVAYKNDPTILGWDLLNGGGTPRGWAKRISAFVHSIDSHHLVLAGPDNATLPNVDACVAFIYPHWALPLSKARDGIDRCTRARKPFLAYEYGWDRTHFRTLRSFERFLATLQRLPGVAGDAFWALQAHAPDHGWQPIPADTSDPEIAATGESGQWWALYYPGRSTLVSSAADMASRAQAIRRHTFAMRGVRVPKHRRPPPAVVTSVVAAADGTHVLWRGSAGARRYSVERRAPGAARWRLVCNRCATDDGFVDAHPVDGATYRVIPFS